MDSQEFEKINASLEQDVELREKIKDQVAELDRKARNMVGLLNKIHATPPEQMSGLLHSVQSIVQSCKETTASLADIIPNDQFWRWKDTWCNSLRTAVFAATLVDYLQNRKLATLAEVSGSLGIKEEWADRINLAVEDYLHGVITMVNELSRYAINSVTLGNFEEPLKISGFVRDLYAGFSMLNLKNDTLRRRFDSLKYDIKKIEEVVYDVSLRKLALSTKS